MIHSCLLHYASILLVVPTFIMGALAFISSSNMGVRVHLLLSSMSVAMGLLAFIPLISNGSVSFACTCAELA